MIYILINNQYHIYDYNQWIEDFKGHQISLIQIPHSLDPIKKDSKFQNIYSYSRFISNIFSLFQFNKIFKIHKKIINEISPNENDVLLVYTEYEILNQYVINIFYKAHAKIWLLEDGLATMTLCNSDSKKNSFKSKIYLFVLKYVYSYKYLKIYHLPDPTPLMDDKLFNGVCVRLGSSIKRQIPLFQISNKNEFKFTNLNSDKAIFINNDLYNFFCTFEDYLEITEKTLAQLSLNFTEIYFKFHPRETDYNINLIKNKINKIPKIKFLDIKGIIEEQVEAIKPKYAFSFVSAALINLFHKGIIPVFLYDTDYKIRNDKFVKEIKVFLESVNYKPIRNIEDFNKNYNSGLEIEPIGSKTLFEIININ